MLYFLSLTKLYDDDDDDVALLNFCVKSIRGVYARNNY